MRLPGGIAAVAVTGAASGIIGRDNPRIPDGINATTTINRPYLSGWSTIQATHVDPHGSVTIEGESPSVSATSVNSLQRLLPETRPQPGCSTCADDNAAEHSLTSTVSERHGIFTYMPDPSPVETQAHAEGSGLKFISDTNAEGSFGCGSVDPACQTVYAAPTAPPTTWSSEKATKRGVHANPDTTSTMTEPSIPTPIPDHAPLLDPDATHTQTIPFLTSAAVEETRYFVTTISRTDATFTRTIPAPPEITSAETPAINVRNEKLNCDCTVDEYGVVYCPPGPDNTSLCAQLITTPFAALAKKSVATPDPTSVLASWVSATNLWPSSVSPFMAPTGSPPSGQSIQCYNNIDQPFLIEPYDAASLRGRSQQHGPGGQAQWHNCLAQKTDFASMSLINGTLIDSHNRIGGIVANNQFQFDGPPQAGTKYDAGWSVCNLGRDYYQLVLGANTTFSLCTSGGFGNIYSWNTAAQCTEVVILVASDETLTGSLIEMGSAASVPAFTTIALSSREISGSRYFNQWARRVDIEGKEHTWWEPYSFITHLSTKYSVSPVTSYMPYPVTTSSMTTPATIDKRNIYNDEPIPLNYEDNTYTISIPARTGVDPSADGSPEVKWTLPARVITVTEHPYTRSTGGSVAARGVTPIPVPDSSSTDPWLTFVSTVPATTVTLSAFGTAQTTLTEPEHTYTSLYRTTPYVTTFTYANGADQVTETWTKTIEPPTFATPCSTTQSKHLPSDATYGLQAREPERDFVTTLLQPIVMTVWVTPVPASHDRGDETKEIDARQIVVSTVTAVVSTPVSTVYLNAIPETATLASETVFSSAADTMSIMSIFTTTAIATIKPTVEVGSSSASQDSSTTPQLQGAANGNEPTFYAALGFGVFAAVVAFCL